MHHVLVVGIAPVGKRQDGDAAAWIEVADDLDILGIHEGNQILHDDVDAILMKVAVVAEAEQIELEALALDHADARDVVDDDAPKVGLPRLGTQRGELRAVERDQVVVLGVLVVKRLKHLWRVAEAVLRALVAQQGHSLQFLFVAWHDDECFRFGLQR